MSVAIKVENLSKAYQLGQIGTGTISRDLERWYARIRGKEDPFLRIGESNDQHSKSESNVVWSLKDINFEIQQGDAVGIIGRNGAGKSTLLKILSKVTAPTTGRITGKGRIASLLEVGTGFHPELSGKENIFLNGAILGMRKKEIQRKLDEIVDFAGIERYLDTPVKRYSSGMYVRLAFAVAAHLESEILIVDEVLAVGDAEFQKKCLGKMGDVSKSEGRTVLFVSHNMESIISLCSSCILLNNGEIIIQDKVDKVVSKYISNSDGNIINIEHLNLNAYVSLKQFEINKNVFESFDDLMFNLEIDSININPMSGLSLLIYNSYEKRVAIIDLRSELLEKSSKEKNFLKLNGYIKNINLIPGSYTIGLFINSDLCSGDFLNILKFQISEKFIDSKIIPYPIEVRGTVSFAHNLNII
ncbi:ABC transporter ATP-binding protein [Pedobacter fastidiosus]|uniref:ABC transporter ATP-binding protein n=1 Tax=Pedobacter fastidiosus TaxID=2765361 RepID=A0ABR7KVP5_9SPHI|nr:ABC transporter ATP-binding protein [Pedobacter fastidiosus]MBC6112185.1 ABC transporter ATP-binding protein [Pedobacter fastidiosus]